MLPNLNDLLQYKNDRIIARYKKDFPNADMQADVALQELMKFMWLCCKHKQDKVNNQLLNFECVIHAEMVDIDNMWHTFLLFTRDYHQFCRDYFHGEFFHHDPLPDINLNNTEEVYETELALYLSYIYDTLGEETLLKWFKSLLN